MALLWHGMAWHGYGALPTSRVYSSSSSSSSSSI